MLTDKEGNEYQEMSAVAGYHVNILPENLTPELEPFIIAVATPRRMYAGIQDTVCLKFADEAEFVSVTGYSKEELV